MSRDNLYLTETAKTLLTISVLLLVNNQAFATKVPDIRGLNIDPVSIQNNQADQESDLLYNTDYKKQMDSPNINKNYTESSATLRGGISEITATVGKSQLIRFDEPVKRISITNPAQADLVLISPKEMLLNGKTAGITSLVIWGDSGDPVFFDLYVKNDSSAFLNAVKAIMPDENLNIKFTDGNNAILSGRVSSTIARDKLKNLADAYGLKLVDLAESPTPQVVMEVKVAEASRSFTKIFNPQAGLQDGDTTTRVKPITDKIIGKAKSIVFDGGENGLEGFIFDPSRFSAALRVLEKKGMVKILAEPKLVSVNGNKASFNAGNQVPVPTSMGEGGNVAYEFKDVGVNVSFTPTILEKSGKILLNIAPEVSEIDSSTSIQKNDGTTIYGFKTRKAETTVELKSGETFVIAGLLQRTDQSSKVLLPILGDIPILGKLFTSTEFRKGETELLIFVTPRIIEPDQNIEGV